MKPVTVSRDEHNGVQDGEGMRVFDFDGTIYNGESLFDLYLFSVRYAPRVLRYIAPVLNCGIRYKIGKAELGQMERKLDAIIHRYLKDLSTSKRLERMQRKTWTGKKATSFFEPNPISRSDVSVSAASSVIADDGAGADHDGLDALSALFWNRKFRKIKSWYVPHPDDVIITASFDLTVAEACRRLGVDHLIASTINPETLEISYLNFNTNKVRRFHEIYGEDAVIDEFYTDSRHDQPMIDIARKAYLVKGDKIIRIK